MREKVNKYGIVIASFVIVSVIVLSLFRHWEPSGETWGYWFFARIFAQTGKINILSRSPIYTFYLSMFRWMGYPLSVTVEYIVSSFIVVTSLTALFKRRIGLFWTVFAVFLWIPFLQVAEPPVQKLALAFSCFAIALRGKKITRFRLAASYALLGISYMLRCTYIVFILVFAIWDSIRLFKQKNLKGFVKAIRPKIKDWPIFFVLALLICFGIIQSNHPWNNAWFTSTEWFPNNGKNLSDASFIQACNWQYISSKYGSFKDKDFYFTNQELFDGANDIFGAVKNNPRFVAKYIARNGINTFWTASMFTVFPWSLCKKAHQLGYQYSLLLFFIIPFILTIIYGAFRACKDKTMVLFLVANIALVVASTLSMPKSRYMYPLIPVFILSAFWYGRKACNLLSRFLPKLWPFSIINYFLMASIFVIFSNGLTSWKVIISDIIKDVGKGEVKVLEQRPYSMKTSFKSLQPLVRNCKGVLSLEHLFIGAFMDIPVDKVYDVYEIPSFGNFSDTKYKGLSPERIDCVLISKELATGIGEVTNYHIRYQNYIVPYANQLQNMGAVEYNLKGFGRAVLLKPKDLNKNIKNEKNVF